jgi:cytochrome c peroxidase
MHRVLLTAAALVVALGGCGGATPLSPEGTPEEGDGPPTLHALTPAETARARTLSPLPDLPPDSTNAYADDPRAATLGQRLFFDSSYSGSGQLLLPRGMACATCHRGLGLADRVQSPGMDTGGGYGGGGASVGKVRNALGLINASYNRWVNWGGRFSAQWELPLAVAENQGIMNSDRLRIARMIFARYRVEYEAVFGPLDPGLGDSSWRFPPSARPNPAAPDVAAAWDRMTAGDQLVANRIFVNYGKSIQAYLRTLVSRRSRFDAFVAGDAMALSDREIAGLKLFLGKARCITCHQGPNFTDDDFHNLGVPTPGAPDMGRYDDIPPLLSSPFNVDGEFSDDRASGRLARLYLPPAESTRGQFRTPTLRNLVFTAPYMHTGQLGNLADVIDLHGRAANGPAIGVRDGELAAIDLTADEKTALVDFLGTLASAPLPGAVLMDTSHP